MRPLPANIAEFLACRTLAVAGVSRDSRQPANAIFRKLRDTGHSVHAVNPNASEVEGVKAVPDLALLPASVEGLVIVTPPAAALALVDQCAALGIQRVWFHRSIGSGSVSDAAVQACRARGISCIVGGCPMMYCAPVDIAHRCMRWWLRWPGGEAR